MDASSTAAFVGFSDVVVGLIGREVIMALLLARQKRDQELAHGSAAQKEAKPKLTKMYADPLLEATRV